MSKTTSVFFLNLILLLAGTCFSISLPCQPSQKERRIHIKELSSRLLNEFKAQYEAKKLILTPQY